MVATTDFPAWEMCSFPPQPDALSFEKEGKRWQEQGEESVLKTGGRGVMSRIFLLTKLRADGNNVSIIRVNFTTEKKEPTKEVW